MPSKTELANALRMLSIDAVEKANSGHPGMPMGMADIAEVLWNDFLRHHPHHPTWPNRDRFILSNGHGSMLLYALLHLSGYDLSMDDLRAFRSLHSKTPGHPESFETPGVETTTGPLGQGLANAVGMALAEKVLAAEFNQENFPIVDHHTYVFVGDGCLMEGISHEACSLAGTLGLGKLIVFWDDNGISIDGQVAPWFNENVPERFRAYHWQVLEKVDGHDPAAISAAIQAAKAEKDRPSLICCRTTIGFGSPNKAGSASVHGSPLGKSEAALVREKLGWTHPPFEIPEDIYEAFDANVKGQILEEAWLELFAAYHAEYPALAAEFQRRLAQELPKTLDATIKTLIANWQAKTGKISTRKASGNFLAEIAPSLPELFGGSADLTGSNCTDWPKMSVVSKDHMRGQYLHYGVREFGMSAMMNGLSLYGGFIPYGGTFLVFQSYCANATRMSALMKQGVIYIFTHDSIGLGEDGPTHQPVMEAQTLRMTPGFYVWRPCDAVETAVAWQQALAQRSAPSALLLSRQDLPMQARDAEQLALVEKGGYILKEARGQIDWIFLATGSEVAIALEAAVLLEAEGLGVRVVSLPCVEVFLEQSSAYQDSVLPPAVSKRLAIEATSPQFWHQFVGREGKVLGLKQFGYSAPIDQVYEACGLTVKHIREAVRS